MTRASAVVEDLPILFRSEEEIEDAFRAFELAANLYVERRMGLGTHRRRVFVLEFDLARTRKTLSDVARAAERVRELAGT